jgi:MoxR-like ATPase
MQDLEGRVRMSNPHEETEAVPTPSPADAAYVDRLQELAGRLKRAVARAIVGQDEVLEEILITLLAGGHAILEGVPGLAKTLIVNSVAAALSLRAGRVQFTPDLMPADVTGTLVVREDPQTKARDFVFRKGPVFVNVLLADEINRSPPKTQAALLEAMAENQVTAAGKRHELPRPYFVLATMNPIEQEGTYPLPEAQLDRFLLKILVDYPSFAEEAAIARRTTGEGLPVVESVLARDEVLALQRVARALPVSDHVIGYATRIARQSRPDEGSPAWIRRLIAWGAGPRASQSLIRAAKARTLLSGRFSVSRADIRAVAPSVLRHRLVPSFQADGEGLGADDLVQLLLDEAQAFPERSRYDATTRKVLRL